MSQNTIDPTFYDVCNARGERLHGRPSETIIQASMGDLLERGAVWACPPLFEVVDPTGRVVWTCGTRGLAQDLARRIDGTVRETAWTLGAARSDYYAQLGVECRTVYVVPRASAA